jgi:methionine sulfoxide reductase catalytic subunit
MHGFARRPFDLPERRITPPEVFFNQERHRREFLASMGRGLTAIGGFALAASGCGLGADPEKQAQEVAEAGKSAPVVDAFSKFFPAERNPKFEYGRPETNKTDAARFTNFYEFSTGKNTYEYVGEFQPSPWKVTVDGLCNKPREFDLGDLYGLASLEERAYRHRCVETWAMCVPWSGYPLHKLLEVVEPKAEARFVAFETFMQPEIATNQSRGDFPWPYTEGLTIAEARNELALLTLGVYGEPLAKQHGAPVRLALPWKYGFKSIKSIVRITLTDQQPKTFWNEVAPHEYAFEANVDPAVPHPRWSQRREYMLGPRDYYDTVKFNGYGDWVAALYA